MARDTQDGGGRHDSPSEAFLITRAETSLDEQHRARVRKYLWMMSFRVPALLVASLVYIWTENAWWAVGIILFSIPLPWMAVLIANDRPPRERGEVQYYRFGPGHTVGPRELAAEPAPPPAPDPSGPVIDPDAPASSGDSDDGPVGTDGDDESG
ncbi:DUF3099 domain-containing protein [Gordonia caeni]|uniref:DUF3099 domain-containing protein n=1 Tax=Gordonia caeni TaxID=1007097 RepID=A0ABP7P6A7_9ACTN